MGEELFYFLFRDKPAKVLLALFNNAETTYASELAKEVDCTYPHMVKVLAGFKEFGLIDVSSTGRVKPIVLTQKGRKIVAKLKALQETLG